MFNMNMYCDTFDMNKLFNPNPEDFNGDVLNCVPLRSFPEFKKVTLLSIPRDDISCVTIKEPHFSKMAVYEVYGIEPIADLMKVPDSNIAIKAKLVKLLREETGAGLMDCKKALLETNWDIFKAKEYLKENYSPIHVLK